MTFVTDSPIQTIRLVDPRTGTPATVSTQLQFNEWALFINDDWKLRRNLTLNIGLRYENYGTMHDRENSLRNLIFGPGSTYQQRLASAKVDTVSQFYPTDNTNFRQAERARAGFDIPHRLSLVGTWDLPFFRNPGLTNKLLGNWRLSGFAILEQGDAITATTTAAYPSGDFNADGNAGDRPNAPAASLQTDGFSRSNYLVGLFPASAFPKPAPGTDGNLGRNTFRGPGFAQTDLSLSKTFKATERLSVRLQVDAFNAFNRVNLADPIMDLSSINFGKSTFTNTPRLYQLGVRVEF